MSESTNKKTFGLSNWSITNPTSVLVLLVIIVLAGFGAYKAMPRESFPEVVVPTIYIGTPYPGNSPTDIEKLISRPIEKELNSITGVDEITSSSVQGYSSIQVEFDFSVSPDEALRKVKDKVDIAMSDPDFPDDLPADPNVFEMNFSELMPVMNINISGDYSMDQLKEYAEYLEDEIEDLPQISKAEIRGVMDKEVKVDLNFHEMEAREVSFADVAGAIQQENMTISGGDLQVGEMRRSVRVIGEFSDWRNFENIVVKHEKGNIVYLRDIGTVEFGEEDKQSYARQYLQPVVMVDVMKRAGENLIEASEAINLIVDQAKEEEFPPNLNITITNDQSDNTKSQVSELENSIIMGMILVIFVLLFFLGFRNSLFVGISIPLSMMLSFLILGAFGVTLNVMVLFSLVLALGMLVDNAIVVVENIYRLREQGYTPIQAAKEGVGEVAWPIIASTATTLAAFVPLAIWPGMMGEFMFFLPVTLMIVLSSSLFVALVINPVLTSKFMKLQEDGIVLNKKLIVILFIVILAGLAVDATGDVMKMDPISAGAGGFMDGLGAVIISCVLLYLIGKFSFLPDSYKKSTLLWPGGMLIIACVIALAMGQNVSANFIGATASFILGYGYIIHPSSLVFQNKFLPWLENIYRSFIAGALSNAKPYLIFWGTVGLLFFSFILFVIFPPKVLFFPENEPQYLNVFIELPMGTDIEKTNVITQEIEKKVMDAMGQYGEIDYVDGTNKSFLIESVIGQVGEGSSDPNQGPDNGETPHKARISINFVKFQERQGVNTSDVLTDVRNIVQSYPGVNIIVSKNENGPPQGAPINIEISGDDYHQLMETAEKMKNFIDVANVQGVEELKLDVQDDMPEMTVTIDRDKARRLGLSTYAIGDAMRTALFGKEVSTYKEGEDDYPINVRFQKIYRDDMDALMNQRITFRDPSSGRIVQVPISAVATAKKTSTFNTVKRKDLNRVITITSNVLEGYNANEVVADIKERLDGYQVSKDVKYAFTGQQEEQAKEMAFLSQALLIAFALIIFIIVVQFNSISAPVIVGSSVVLSLIGVLLGLIISGQEFVIIMTMIGIISLAGIVVNNAIVLLDYTNLLMDRKKEELGLDDDELLPFKYVKPAIEEAGRTRLRPVLLTAITTVLGLLPLAVGFNMDFQSLFVNLDPQIFFGGDNVGFWGPMASAIMYGLTFATFLTLVVVPVMYFLIKKTKYRIMKGNASVREEIQS